MDDLECALDRIKFVQSRLEDLNSYFKVIIERVEEDIERHKKKEDERFNSLQDRITALLQDGA